jgi:membrane protein implicated in regulation of membrane protease activity
MVIDYQVCSIDEAAEMVVNLDGRYHGLDVEGTVSVAIEPHRRGKVIFDSPVLGNTVWHASSDTAIAKGSRVRIVEINGQLIDVTPV